MNMNAETRLLVGEPKSVKIIKIGNDQCFIISQNERKCQLREKK